MPVTLAITGRSPISVTDQVISLGSDATCHVSLPDDDGLKPKHAVIRSIAGRWLIEVREGEAVFVGGPEPRRLQWLNPGDRIRLTENGPVITFEPGPVQTTAAVAQANPTTIERPSSASNRRADDVLPVTGFDSVVLPPDSDPAIPTNRAATPPPSSYRSPSSDAIPVSNRNQSVASGTPNSNLTRSQTVGQSTSASNPDEPAPNAPVLRRMSASDPVDNITSIDLSQEQQELTPEEKEMRWIMTLVIRAVGVGLGIIVVWTFLRTLTSSMTPPAAPASPSSSIERVASPSIVARRYAATSKHDS